MFEIVSNCSFSTTKENFFFIVPYNMYRKKNIDLNLNNFWKEDRECRKIPRSIGNDCL